MLGLSSKEFCALFSAKLPKYINGRYEVLREKRHEYLIFYKHCYVTIRYCFYPDGVEDHSLFMNVIDLSSLSAFFIKIAFVTGYSFSGHPC